MVLGKLNRHMSISEVRTHLHTTHKNKLRMGQVLDMRHDIIKLPEKNIGKTFSDINCTNIFLGQSPKAREIWAKIDK